MKTNGYSRRWLLYRLLSPLFVNRELNPQEVRDCPLRLGKIYTYPHGISLSALVFCMHIRTELDITSSCFLLPLGSIIVVSFPASLKSSLSSSAVWVKFRPYPLFLIFGRICLLSLPLSFRLIITIFVVLPYFSLFFVSTFFCALSLSRSSFIQSHISSLFILYQSA